VDPEHEDIMQKRATRPTRYALGMEAQIEKALIAEAALQLDRMNYKLVIVRHGTKAALFKAWQERDPLTRLEIQTHTRRKLVNIGIDLRRSGNLVVFDKDATSMEAFRWLQRYGLLKTETQVETSKGLHYYWRLPEGVEDVRSKIKFLGMPLDVKVTGYTLMAPSWVSETEWRYRIREGKKLLPLSELPVVPDEVVELLTRKEEPKWKPKPLPELPEEKAIEGLRKWVRHKIAREGSGGDLVTYKVAVKIASVISDFDRAMQELLAWDRECAVPPWSDTPQGLKAIERKMRCAFDYVQKGKR
jgi:hypothetical protein